MAARSVSVGSLLDSLTRCRAARRGSADPDGDELQYARELREWRERRGMTKKALADAMAYDPSRVSHVEGGRQPPTEEFTRQAEATLQTGGALWARWEAIAASRFGLTSRPVERDLRTAPFIAWLADHSDASFQSLYSAVNTGVARLEAEPPSLRHSRDHSRRLVSRDQLAHTIARYYGEPARAGCSTAPGRWVRRAAEHPHPARLARHASSSVGTRVDAVCTASRQALWP